MFLLGRSSLIVKMVKTDNCIFSVLYGALMGTVKQFSYFPLLGQKEQGFTEILTERIMNGSAFSDRSVRMN